MLLMLLPDGMSLAPDTNSMVVVGRCSGGRTEEQSKQTASRPSGDMEWVSGLVVRAEVDFHQLCMCMVGCDEQSEVEDAGPRILKLWPGSIYVTIDEVETN